MLKDNLRLYYNLTKPGIIYGNILTATGGYMLASAGRFHVLSYMGVIFGMSSVIASACVINNFIDRDIDRKMERTKNRAFATGRINTNTALIFAIIIGFIGFWLLHKYTNLLTLMLGATGYVFYIVFYGIAKRTTVHGTLVGSISGAMPPVAGYCAVTNRFDIGAWLLLIAMVFWQMPHFYAIAIYRFKDYKSAKLPVMSVYKGIEPTKVRILFYIIGFVITCILFSVLGVTGYTFGVVMGIVGMSWFYKGFKTYLTKDSERWAKGMFFYSLKIIMLFSLLLTLNNYLP